jgi:hypothetical protein
MAPPLIGAELGNLRSQGARLAARADLRAILQRTQVSILVLLGGYLHPVMGEKLSPWCLS